MRVVGVSIGLLAALSIAFTQANPAGHSLSRAQTAAVTLTRRAPDGTRASKTVGEGYSTPKPQAAPVNSYLQMPLNFELNRGQAPKDYPFVAHGPSYSLGISTSGLALSLHRPNPDLHRDGEFERGVHAYESTASSILRLTLSGATSGSQISGLDSQPGLSNYFIGNDPARWQRSVPHFGKVKIAGAYPGIDAIFYGNREHLEYDFDVAPGADPDRIRLKAEGTEAVTLDANGNALLHTAQGDVELLRPVTYQEVAGVRHPVESAFRVTDGTSLEFALGKYDHTRPLVIDPELVYGVSVGGSNGNQALGLAVDSLGNTYLSGLTCSADFPSTAGAFEKLPTDATRIADCDSAFVVKMDPIGSGLIYSDFFGGTKYFSAGGHIAVDASGDVFLAGATGAPDFPLVSNIGPKAPNACNVESGGENCPVGFVLKLNPNGSQILFSSLLGGSQASLALQAKLDPVSGDLVVLGETNSSDFLPAPTTLQTTFGGGSCFSANPCFDGFLLGLNPATGALRYGSFIGGAGNDWSSGLAFDKSGNIYVSGSTQGSLSSSLGAVTHTYKPSGSFAPSGQALYVARFNLSGSKLSPGYLTLIHGDGDTAAGSIVLDSAGNLYLGGGSAALHLPVTSGVFQTTNKTTFGSSCLWPKISRAFLPNPCGTGVVGKLNSTGALSFLTYLGGSGQDMVQSIGVDSSGDIWLGGVTSSTDFPTSADKYASGLSYFTPFLAEMSNTGTKLPFATLVGPGPGMVSDLDIDASNNIYIAGFGSSSLTTPGVYPTDPNVFSPAFLQKWKAGPAPSISVSTTGLGFGSVAVGSTTQPQTATIKNSGTVPMEIGVSLGASISGDDTNDFLLSTTCRSSLAAGGSCTVSASFQPGLPSAACVAQPGCVTSQRSAGILITNNAPQGPQTISLSGTTGVGASISVSPNPILFPAQAAGTASTALNVQLGNAGDSELLFGNIAVSGPNAADFQLSQTGAGGPACSAGVPPGSFCDVSLTFSPAATATGTRTATLALTDSAGNSPQSISITGSVASANFLNISPLNLSPTFPVAFGTSSSATLDLENPSSTKAVQVTGLTIAGTNKGDFSVAPGSCASIAAKATCYLSVKFAPAAGASGTRTATLTVQTNPAAAGLPTVSLSGDAVTNSQPGLKIFTVPSPMNFGALQLGETSNNASVLFNVANNAPIPCANGTSICGAPLVIKSIGAGLGDYTLVPGQATCTTFPATIPTGGNCTYALQFKPAQAGARNTIVTIQSNDPQGAVQLPVFGSGLSLPLGEFLQTALNFGNSAIGKASPPLTTTLFNGGLANLAVSAVTASANFSVSSTTCKTAPLAPRATCTITVTFTPPAAGFYSGTLTIADNGGFSKKQTVNLTGTGATGPQLRLMPPTLNFGNQAVNTLSAAQTITLTSTGDTALTFPANAIRTSVDFVLQSTTCGTTLAPGASCKANIQFKPYTTVIAESGTLLITDNAAGSPQPVFMQGIGVPATTTTTLVSSLNPAASGQSITFTATVKGPAGNAAAPTGFVNFLNGTTIIGTSALNAAGQATYSTSALTVGSHALTATYLGDTNFSTSMSTVLTQVVNLVTPAPVFKPAGGTYNTAQSVTISDAIGGAVIYYTTNGSMPTTSSTKYSGAIKVSTKETLKAIAVASGFTQSSVATAVYTIP